MTSLFYVVRIECTIQVHMYGYKCNEQAEYWVHEVYCCKRLWFHAFFSFIRPVIYLASRVRIFLLLLEQKRTTKSRAAPFRAAPRLASEHPTCPCLLIPIQKTSIPAPDENFRDSDCKSANKRLYLPLSYLSPVHV